MSRHPLSKDFDDTDLSRPLPIFGATDQSTSHFNTFGTRILRIGQDRNFGQSAI